MRCEAETSFRPTKYGSSHTVQCQKDASHEGGHEYEMNEGRHVIWYGEPKKVDHSQKYRFGRNTT